MRSLLYYIFIIMVFTRCAPSNSPQSFNPTDPTNISNPNPPIVNAHHYYRVNFLGSESGLRINGSQKLFLPDEIAVYSNTFPPTIALYSDNFSCYYDLNQSVYYKRPNCLSSYSINNQIVYVHNLSYTDSISIEFGLDSI